MNTTSFSNNSDDDYQTAAEWLEQLSEQPLDELSKRRLLLWLDGGNERRALFERMLGTWADPALTQAAQSLLASESAHTATNAIAGFRRGAAWALCLTLCVALLVSNRFLGEAPAAKTLPFATATGIVGVKPAQNRGDGTQALLADGRAHGFFQRWAVDALFFLLRFQARLLFSMPWR